MLSGLLVRGLIAGCLAGLIAACFAAITGEPSLQRAIEIELALAKGAQEAEIVSREIQRTVGLLVAGMIQGGAIGGIFSLAFAFAQGRIGNLDARIMSALLAAAGFVAIAYVPSLKYPANPPSFGHPGTLSERTWLYVAMVLISVLALALATTAWPALRERLGRWGASLASALLFVAVVAVAGYLLPSVNEVPDSFPFDALRSFRLAAFGTQVILWSGLGLFFGMAVQWFPGWRSQVGAGILP